MAAFYYLTFVPLALGIILAGLVIYWDHKKAMARIENSLYQPLSRAQAFLAWGLVILGIGVALFVGAFWVGIPEIEPAGLVLVFAGMALLISYAVTSRKIPSQ